MTDKPSKILPRPETKWLLDAVPAMTAERKAKARKAMKKRGSARTNTVAAKSARGQSCTLLICNAYDPATVVLCHLRHFGGGGMATKPDDAEAVYACAYCHDVIDGRCNPPAGWNPAKLWECIARALVATHRVMRASGVLIFRGEEW